MINPDTIDARHSPLPRLTVIFLLSHAVSFFYLYVFACLVKPDFLER